MLNPCFRYKPIDLMRLKLSLVFIYLLLLCISIPIHAKNSVLALDLNHQKVEISPYIEILEDKKSAYTINQVKQNSFDSKWQLNTKPTISFAFSQSTYWLRLTLHSKLTINESWWLEIPFANQDYIEFYIFDQRGMLLDSISTGDRMPFNSRPVDYHNFLFNIPIEPQQTRTVYIKLNTHDGLHEPTTPLLWNKETFSLENGKRQMTMGIYLGFILVMAIYNLFIFLSVRDVAYFYYVGYISSLFLWFVTYMGFPLQYLWPNSPSWDNHFQMYTASLWGVFAVQFVRHFLSTKIQVPWFEIVGKIIITGLLVSMVMTAFSIYAVTVKLQIFIAISFVFCCFIAGFQSYKQGFRPAGYFLLAWTAFLISLSIFALKVGGLLPPIFIFEKALQFGSTIEVVLLSLGLADRINSLKRQKEQAQQAALAAAKEANELKDEFLANTSHELRTPLNGIIGLAESLLDGIAGKLPTKANQNLAMVVASGKRLSNLVNDILDFSKLKKRNLELHTTPIDLRSLTDVVLTLSQLLIDNKEPKDNTGTKPKADIELINNIPDDLPSALADESRLQQILHNLLGNAIKFTHQGQIILSASHDEKYITINIEDTGIGIAPDKFATIFNSFEQVESHLSRSQSGTGLGLSITKQLINLHKGEIWLESTLGKGSIFSFSLPISNHVAQPVSVDNFTEQQQRNTLNSFTDDSIQMPKPADGKQYKLLIVDDEPINRQVLVNHLSIHDFHLTEAGDGQQALDAIENQGSFDLVLLDIMMPKASGYEVCKKLRETNPLNDLPVIFLTAKNQVADLMQSFAVGGNDYLSKPVNKHELLARVNTHLNFLDINRNLEGKVKERTQTLEQKNRQIERSQQKLITTQQQLVQSEKMAALGVLTAGVAHEINNPTNFVHVSVINLQNDLDRLKAFIYELAGDEADDSILDMFKAHFTPLYDHLTTINSGTDRIQMIVKDLKTFTQLDGAESQLIDISKLLQSTINLIKNQNSHIKEFNTKLPSMPEIQCHPAQLNQVFMNLITNACDAVKKRQDAEKEQDLPLHIGLIQLKCHADETHIHISIKDNGCGIEHGLQQKVFEPFYTTKEIGAGTGLGLSIVFGIIEQHKGNICVASNPNQGSEFTISLPMDTEQASEKAVKEADEQPPVT